MTLLTGQQFSAGEVRDPDGRIVVTLDSSGGGAGTGAASYPSGAVPVANSSGNVAAASAVATLAAAASLTTYITGFQVTAAGATAASVVTLTVAGIKGGTLSYTFAAPAGATLAASPLVVEFPLPIPASAVNTAIVVTLPSLGAGNTNATVSAQGFQA